MPNAAPLFTAANLQAFSDACASDPAFDLGRVHARNQLRWLHERLYPTFIDRRYDLHYYPGWSLTPAQVSDRAPRIEHVELRYTKAETAVRLLRKQLKLPGVELDQLAWLGLRVDAAGLWLVWRIPAAALGDSLNLKRKFEIGSSERQTLQQGLAEAGGGFTLLLEQGGIELFRARAARLVDLGVLESVLGKFEPGSHEWSFSTRYSPDDARIDSSRAPNEILDRMTVLYPLYQYAVWAPRNNYLATAERGTASGAAPSSSVLDEDAISNDSTPYC